jgi:transposase
MAKVFRSWDVDQGWLLPPLLREFVPPGHMAHFVCDTVLEALDLSAILGVYTEDRSYPPYHPGMMVALLLYSYSRGLYSSRQLARACEERVDVMAVAGLNRPDFRTMIAFVGTFFVLWALGNFRFRESKLTKIYSVAIITVVAGAAREIVRVAEVA